MENKEKADNRVFIRLLILLVSLGIGCFMIIYPVQAYDLQDGEASILGAGIIFVTFVFPLFGMWFIIKNSKDE